MKKVSNEEARSLVPRSPKKIVILDRDGIINEDSPAYIKSKEEFVFLPGSIDAIVQLTAAGYRIGVATNQSGIARDLYGEVQLAEIHDKMIAGIALAGGRIDEIMYCPHAPDEHCQCRKPKPGMLLDLARKFDCDARDLVFIGDKITDIQAAEQAGAQAVLVLSTMTKIDEFSTYHHVPVYDSLQQYVHALLGTAKS
ncbi:MAG: D-glycero-beta-D-manno-heptose 1,7-bisphosphate 7-phosphatase [Gammaproteobacteria bacterium]|nr:D-glycero-beta-D-manno-heptose 1,7-bisphosphate 7-phosphatase [Gammaproteobacteria bacterium]